MSRVSRAEKVFSFASQRNGIYLFGSQRFGYAREGDCRIETDAYPSK
ncbi:Uncharacterized protein ChrSV_0558 [Chromobacterium vaccinii]|nr:Uncharacterized protein ChrSW_0558 [Chromobacterium vaccinii]QND88017.1 Uncharacterized protein ChrSV_0558 [Chromobacterium vaccinii]